MLLKKEKKVGENKEGGWAVVKRGSQGSIIREGIFEQRSKEVGRS